MKMVVLGTVPAICGISVASMGEKISWPEQLTAQTSYQAATQAAAPTSQPGQVVEEARPMMILIAGQRR